MRYLQMQENAAVPRDQSKKFKEFCL